MTVLRIGLWLVEAVNAAALLGLVGVAAGFLVLPVLRFVQQRRRSSSAAGERGPETDEAALPHVLVQLPVYNESGLVSGLLDAVAALDWPRDKLHVQLLDDSWDETSDIARSRIDELWMAGLDVVHLQRPHRAGFKAEALAAGLTCNDAPYVAILDADFRPPPQWLRVVMPQLLADPDAGFVQSRCEYANAHENWLTRAQGLLLDAHYVMEHGVRARAGLMIQFNGTCAVWRRAAIEAAGGWCSASLSEDLNLTVRAALAGWRGLFAAEPAVAGQAPHELLHWRVQQRRWSMGFAQNARTLAARIWTSGWTLPQKLSAEFMLLYQLIGLPLIVAAIAASVLDVAFGVPDLAVAAPLWGLVALMALALAVAMTLPPYLELRRGGLAKYLASLATIPALVVFLSFANGKAIASGLFGNGGHFHRTPKSDWREREAVSVNEFAWSGAGSEPDDP